MTIFHGRVLADTVDEPVLPATAFPVAVDRLTKRPLFEPKAKSDTSAFEAYAFPKHESL